MSSLLHDTSSILGDGYVATYQTQTPAPAPKTKGKQPREKKFKLPVPLPWLIAGGLAVALVYVLWVKK